jgi:2-keto-4-pentenoate hydratase
VTRPLLLAAALLALPAVAGENHALAPDQLAQHLRDHWPVNRPLPVTTLEQAYAYQFALLQEMSGEWGQPVGYKAALTSPALQRRFRAERPVLGVLTDRMLLKDRHTFDEGFAARPVLEADLIAFVGDEAINGAATRADLLAAIDGFHPVIEVPDLVFMDGVTPLPLWLTAINAGARHVLVGDPALREDFDDWEERLPLIQASVMDRHGQVLARGGADRLMGHPLDAVAWIRDEVIQRGGRLKKGDVLLLGSLTDPIPVEPGRSYQVLFTGLRNEPVSLQVNIRTRPTHP